MAEQSGGRARGFRSPAWIITVACLGSATVTSGIQAVAPAIPAIQSQFSLSPAQVALITSVYLFPSMFSAFVGGGLADRFGVRPVFAGALVLFGAGAVVLIADHTFAVLLGVRFVQGAAFGVVVSLSVSIIGGIVAVGPQAARAQGQRIITMAAAEAVFPALAGLLIAVAWYAPFAIQLLALPLGAVCWIVLPSERPTRKAGARASLRVATASRGFLGVQVLAAARFLFKFAVLTYYPLLAVNEIGLSAASVGVVLGVGSVISVVMAWLTEKLAHRWLPSQMIGGCLAVIALSMLGMGVADSAPAVIAALWLFGLQDGVFGVAHNVLVTELAPRDVRSTYVGVTGAVRNVGKFMAPAVFGALTFAFTISQSFLLLAGSGAALVAVARAVVRAQRAEPPDGDES